MHMITGMAILALGHIAGRVSGAEYFFHGAALTTDFHQTDADADGENLVLPHKAIVIQLAYHVFGNLRGLLQRTASQHQTKFITAQAPNRIRVTHRVFDQRRHFAQQAVTGQMTGGVIDGLEAIQIEVAQHMMGGAGARQVNHFLQATLELTPIDQTGECVMQ